MTGIYTATTVVVDDPVKFYGRIDWRKIGNVVLSDIHSSSSTVVRESRHIHSAEDNLIQINFQIEGVGSVDQDSRAAVTHPGEMVIYDSARPYQMRFDGPFRQFSVDFPRSMLRGEFGRTERFTARSFSGTAGPGRFLYAYVQSLLQQQDDSDQLIAGRLQEHLMHLLVTAVSGIARDSNVRGSDGRAMTLSRVKAYLNAHLHDPELSPGVAAQAQGLSLRYLYDLFEDEGATVRRYIQDARLDRCRENLENAGMFGRSLSDIAFAWGFKDPAHFSRAFRNRFGMTPRECRADRKAHLVDGHSIAESAKPVK